MDLFQNIVSKFKKDDDSKFESSQYAACIVAPSDEDTLMVSKSGFDGLTKSFGDVVSLVGPPGVGKSTLGSTIYNIMRNNKDEYFKASDCMEGFTKGIWTLNHQTKCLFADRDKVDVLDLEGLEDENSIHYLVVVAMALSKALLLCANYAIPRFKFDMFKTLQAGVNIYEQNKIAVPKPIIYIQVPFGMNEFKLRNKIVDKNGLLSEIKKKFPFLQKFEMRTFALPPFGPNGNRFDKPYQSAVGQLIDELKVIHNISKIEDRVKYADHVVIALNKNSPEIITAINLKFFKNEVEKRSKEIEANSVRTVRNEAESKTKLFDKMISFDVFCKSVYPPNGRYHYNQVIRNQVQTLAFYQSDNIQHQKVVQELDDEKKYYLDVKDHCKDIYDAGITSLKSKLLSNGEHLKEENDKAFKAFTDLEVNRAGNKIKFDGDTEMPHELRSAVMEKRRVYRNEIIEKTQNELKLDEKYLSMDILETKWTTKVNDLKADWESRKQVALGSYKRKVTTSGNHTCPAQNCGKSHNEGICCSGSNCGQKSLYYWVDGETSTCICDVCKTTTVITGVCCWTCGTRLNVSIKPM